MPSLYDSRGITVICDVENYKVHFCSGAKENKTMDLESSDFVTATIDIADIDELIYSINAVINNEIPNGIIFDCERKADGSRCDIVVNAVGRFQNGNTRISFGISKGDKWINVIFDITRLLASLNEIIRMYESNN